MVKHSFHKVQNKMCVFLSNLPESTNNEALWEEGKWTLAKSGFSTGRYLSVLTYKQPTLRISTWILLKIDITIYYFYWLKQLCIDMSCMKTFGRLFRPFSAIIPSAICHPCYSVLIPSLPGSNASPLMPHIGSKQMFLQYSSIDNYWSKFQRLLNRMAEAQYTI